MSRADGDVSDNSSVASEGDWYDAIAAGEVIGRFLDAIQAAGAMAAPSVATDVVDGTRAPTSDAAATARRRAVLFRAADACDGLVSKVRESAVYVIFGVFLGWTMWPTVGALALTLVALGPFLFRVARVTYLNIFVHFDPNAVKKS